MVKRIAAGTLLLLILPLALLGLAELVAYGAGVGYPTSLFIKDKLADGQSCLRINYQAAKRFFPGRLARRPLPEIMADPKPDKLLRIFVLGESAARGEKLADFSFARMLETAINRDSPQKVAEVINTGIPAINSWVLREFCQEIVNYQPDALVIYGGHNEFIGPYGPASVFGMTRNRTAALTGIWASSLRIIQALKTDHLPAELASGWQGLQMFLKNSIAADSPAVNECLSNWQANLQDILALAQEHKIPVVWCRVPVNRKDCPPFISDTKGISETDQQKIDEFVNAFTSGNFEQTEHLAHQLTEIAANHALFNYVRACMSLKKGQTAQAQELFKKALDLDCFRVRTTDMFNDAAQELAKRYGAQIADVETYFAESTGDGVIGTELVYDHVHLTEKGHHLAAHCIYNALTRTGLRTGRHETFPDRIEILKMLGYSGADAVANLEHIVSSLNQPPFTMQFAHEQRLAGFEELLGILRKVNDSNASIAATSEAQQRQPYNHAISLRLAMLLTDQPEAATRMFAESLKQNPFNIDTLNNLALLKLQQNNHAEADRLLKQATALAPNFAQAHFNLGLVAAAGKNLTRAAQHYQTAVAADPSMFLALRNLGNLHFRSGEFAQALSAYKMAARAAPRDLPSHIGIGNSLMELKETASAIESYQHTMAAFADSPLPRYSLGKALEASNRLSEAADLYEQAARSGHIPSLQNIINLQLQEKFALSEERFAELCQLGCELTEFKDPWFNQTLAISHAQRGELEEALGILHRAADLAKEHGQTALLHEIEANIDQLNSARKGDGNGPEPK